MSKKASFNFSPNYISLYQYRNLKILGKSCIYDYRASERMFVRVLKIECQQLHTNLLRTIQIKRKPIYGRQFFFIKANAQSFSGDQYLALCVCWIISKHSLHILTISQNKRHIHSQHNSPKLCCRISPLGIFSWSYGTLWMVYIRWELSSIIALHLSSSHLSLLQ